MTIRIIVEKDEIACEDCNFYSPETSLQYQFDEDVTWAALLSTFMKSLEVLGYQFKYSAEDFAEMLAEINDLQEDNDD